MMIDPAMAAQALRQPPAIMQSVAAQGRRGDTTLGHLTPGEVVLPRSVLTPRNRAMIAQMLRNTGHNPDQYQVGGKDDSVNPTTGLKEFNEDDWGGQANESTPAGPDSGAPDYAGGNETVSNEKPAGNFNTLPGSSVNGFEVPSWALDAVRSGFAGPVFDTHALDITMPDENASSPDNTLAQKQLQDEELADQARLNANAANFVNRPESTKTNITDDRNLLERGVDWGKSKIEDAKQNPIATLVNILFGAVPIAGLVNTISGLAGGPTVGKGFTAGARELTGYTDPDKPAGIATGDNSKGSELSAGFDQGLASHDSNSPGEGAAVARNIINAPPPTLAAALAGTQPWAAPGVNPTSDRLPVGGTPGSRPTPTTATFTHNDTPVDFARPWQTFGKPGAMQPPFVTV